MDQPVNPAASGPKKILMVEDDDDLAGVYITRLQAEGFETQRVSEGDQALPTAKTFQPDLILLDVMMPKMSGFDVLQAIRQDPVSAKQKVIILTALAGFEDRQRAEALGVDDYLVKSQVAIADVVAKIKEHLGLSQSIGSPANL